MGDLIIDNVFGSKTLASLQKYNLSIISSKEELSSFVKMLENKKSTNEYLIELVNNSSTLVSVFSNDISIKYLYFIADGSGKQVIWDKNLSEWRYTNLYQLPVKKGLKLSVNDYFLNATNYKNGELIIYCNKGTNIGYWAFNPKIVTLI